MKTFDKATGIKKTRTYFPFHECLVTKKHATS